MTEKLNIVQSTTEPDKKNIWLKDNELKKFGAKGWSTIGGSNTGGGNGDTSTDKDALYIYIDINTYNITINNKVYITSHESSNYLNLTITDKELYDTLYNFLYRTNRTIYLKSLPNDEIYLFGICTGSAMDKSRVNLMFLTLADIISITVSNK